MTSRICSSVSAARLCAIADTFPAPSCRIRASSASVLFCTSADASTLPFAAFFPSTPWQPVHFDRKIVCPSATLLAAGAAAGGAGFGCSAGVVVAGAGAGAGAGAVVAVAGAVVEVAGGGVVFFRSAFFAGAADDVVTGEAGAAVVVVTGAEAAVSVAVAAGTVLVVDSVAVDAVVAVVAVCVVSVVVDSCFAHAARRAMRKSTANFFMLENICNRLSFVYAFPRLIDVTGNPAQEDDRITGEVIMT